MLNTPFGTIKIIADGIMLDYEAIPFSSQVRSIVAKPLAGCYRITVPTKNYHNIRCELEWSCEPIENTGSSGERFLCSEYEQGNTILTIGAEDENDAYKTVRYENGMGYNIVQPTDIVVFGIAWATDHEDGDVRTWLAADPS